MNEICGHMNGPGRRVGLVASRFNGALVEQLVHGARDALIRHGVGAEGITLVRVPGAFEIPLALEEMAASGRFDGLVALGVVIRGETPHFDYVCGACTRGVTEVSQRHRLPVGFGVLTCDTVEQATARAGGKAGNKGAEAAIATLEMIDLVGRLRAEA